MYKAKIRIYFKQFHLGLRHFSHPYAQTPPPIEIGREAVLDVWVLLEQGRRWTTEVHPQAITSGSSPTSLKRADTSRRSTEGMLPVGIFIG